MKPKMFPAVATVVAFFAFMNALGSGHPGLALAFAFLFLLGVFHLTTEPH